MAILQICTLFGIQQLSTRCWDLTERSYALKLVQDITPDKLESWSKGDPVAWANEGYEIAANKVYGKLPHSGTLPESYEAEALPIVNAQLAAGWRSVGNGTEQLSANIVPDNHLRARSFWFDLWGPLSFEVAAIKETLDIRLHVERPFDRNS